MTTPRSDSLASLMAASATATSATTPSVPRSRKKLKHRSSLEFLEGNNDVPSSSGPTSNKSANRKRKLASSSLTSVSPNTTTLPQSQPSKKQLRDMSPQSKSKLCGLGKQIHPRSKIKEKMRKQENKIVSSVSSDGAARTKKKKIPQKNTVPEPPKRKTAERSAQGERDNERDANFAHGESRLLRQSDPSKKHPTKEEFQCSGSKQSPLHASKHEHLTPPQNRANNTEYQKQSPEISFSPLDYRPQNNTNNANVDGMLNSYAEQWTKPSPDNNREERRANELNNADVDRMSELDDPSSSVISTSSNSENDDDEGDYDGAIIEKLDNPTNHDTQLPRWENDIPSPLKLNKKLELDYGRLAFMKQELDRKMQLHKMDDGGTIEKFKQNAFKSSHLDNEGQQQLGSNGMALPPSIKVSKNLQVEYGRLAYLKQELEQKMRIQKMDAEKVNPWLSHSPSTLGMGAAATNNDVAGGREQNSTNNFLLKASSANTYDDSIYQSGTNIEKNAVAVGAPSRKDIAYGEMAYMREQRMAQLKGGGQGDAEDEVTNYEKHSQQVKRLHIPPHYGATKDYSAEYNRKKKYVDRGNTFMPSSSKSKPKPKKKRKRRVVETITRVIHEESEEEGSSSTGRETHGQGYFDPRPNMSQFLHTGNYYEDGDDDKYYGVTESKARRSSYSRKHSFSPDRRASTVPHQRGRDYTTYEQSDGDSFQAEDQLYGDEDGHSHRYLSQNKKQARKQRTPDRDVASHARGVAHGRKKSSAKEKKRKNQNEGLNNRGRFHTSQPSMLESLH
eukprot:CAMPEP_0172322656 /NCGR_PEP_ID=MMETSP1058-20130122/46512_1 /TAXON_ID=83371 /ORGANISM="Detonula confervacea, Strain CCMP 353" /LENGTH=786 /DNA_ID=CAMNT_0013038459 /DNA_START=29 /DNA_END=2389 /DNA_ORIENTATION=-